ncbi:gp45 [Alphaproteobacteria phage PhiJL001]|uniref:Gp45 n=1 Tax=Alphaproteobacteria phage PhiJL001 TaxID=2681607 RepID=Q5DN60_9CAUD|nr:gp45 [Alphaproteobacteria phage PhiJL001]AAT69521.1 gp45 [Alphaproteobacteria phage PhiJL001]
MEKIESFNNNCTLVAVKAVMNGTKTDDEILAAFRGRGYEDNQGMTHSKWTGAARDLGLSLRSVALPRRGYKWVSYTSWHGEEWERRVRVKYTLKEFCEAHPRGVFLVSVPGHAFVVVHGQVWDPNCVHQTMARHVEAVKEVLNPPLNEICHDGKIRSLRTGRVGSKSFQRRWSAVAYIQEHGPQTGETLVRETEYTQADFEFDKKRGNLRYETA